MIIMIIITLHRQLKYYVRLCTRMRRASEDRRHLKDTRKMTHVNKEYELWSIKKYKFPHKKSVCDMWAISHERFPYGFRLCIIIMNMGVCERELKDEKSSYICVPIRCDQNTNEKKLNSWISISKIEVISNAIFTFCILYIVCILRVPSCSLNIWYVHFWNTRYFMYEIELKLKPLMCDSIAW